MMYEQHLSVRQTEEFALNKMGYNIVNVTQKLDIDYSNKTGDLSIKAYADVFPFAIVNVEGQRYVTYNQPSFPQNFAFRIHNNRLVREYIPARCFLRN